MMAVPDRYRFLCHTTGDTVNEVYPYRYNFEGYELVLVAMWGKSYAKVPVEHPIFVCCDVVEQTLVAGTRDRRSFEVGIIRPLVAPSSLKWDSPEHIVLQLRQTQINTLRLYLVTSEGIYLERESNWSVHCLFELRKKKKE